MGRWTNENHGQKFWEQLASEHMSDEKIMSKIWSKKFEAWGFYDLNVKDTDEFVFWCGSKIGDRIHLGTLGMQEQEVGIILEKRDDAQNSICVMKVLQNDGRTIELSVGKRKLFNAAWELTK